MKRRIKILFWGTLSFVLFFGYQVKLLPVVIYKSTFSGHFETGKSLQLEKGDTLDLFKEYDFKDGNYSLFIVFSRDELESYPKILFTNTPSVLTELKEVFKLTYTGGDMATCQSSLFLLQDDKIILNQRFAINKNNVGLQSRKYGWIQFIDKEAILKNLHKLEPTYWPFICI